MFKWSLDSIIRRNTPYQNYAKKRVKWALHDTRNLIAYGTQAPLTAQLVFVDPCKIDQVYYGDLLEGELPPNTPEPRYMLGGRKVSGSVVGGNWDKETVKVSVCPKFVVCVNRFSKGMSWEKTGAYDLMEEIIKVKPGADGCYCKRDIVERYKRLDKMFCVISKERRLKQRLEIKPNNFREQGGVYVHVDRRGAIIFGGGGWHRLAIAKILGLESIPAQLGVVHEKAVDLWKSAVSIP